MDDLPAGLVADLDRMRQGAELFSRCVDELADRDFARPSLLPGWTRAHVAAHVARNAAALANLARWAATGVETPMYASTAQRAADIASGAARPAATIRADLATQDRLLADALAELDERSWCAAVRTAHDREVPAAAIPWLRGREVWIHAVDLDAGVGFSNLPPPLTGALLTDVANGLGRRADCPPMTLVGDDGRRWHIGEDDASPAPTTVQGPPSRLLAWLAGRGTDHDLLTSGPAVTVPRWL